MASPTKRFFVRMLTRDIELQDSILDLLDNCVDGILRSGTATTTPGKPYEGFRASITMAPGHFVVEDNCGGIPIEIAKKYAFAMGRPPGADASDVPASVGMYGIGMKRAIFKLGTEALVESRHDTGFVVEFSPEWMQTDKWDDLPMYELAADKLVDKGTRIEVYQLNPDVQAAFSDKAWIDEFRKTVARHYSIIISKGFTVTPTELPLVLSEAFSAAALKALPVSEPNSFAPLSIIRYADGQQMLSITGAVVKRDDEEAMRASLGLDNWPFASTDWTTIHRLVVPDLTVRERLFLERGVISKTPDELMKELGFECAGEIQVTEFLENYKSYYRFYPTLLSAEI